MTTRTAAVMYVLLAIAGCSPGMPDVERLSPGRDAITAVYSTNEALVRRAIAGALAERGVGVEADDRVASKVVTKFSMAAPGEDERACTGLAPDHGEWVSAIRYRLWFEIVPRRERSTLVRLRADVQGRVSRSADAGGHAGTWMDCDSTGEIERAILDEVQSRLDSGA